MASDAFRKTFILVFVAEAGDAAPCQNEQNVAKCDGFVMGSKTTAGVGRLKRICNDSFHAASAVQEAYPSDM